MIYICSVCHSKIEDNLPDLPVEKAILSKTDKLELWCDTCGALMAPEHFTPEELETWYAYLSNCPNAQHCIGSRAYRPDCERGVFYPGCLKFLWRELYAIKLLLRNRAGINEKQMFDLHVEDAQQSNMALDDKEQD